LLTHCTESIGAPYSAWAPVTSGSNPPTTLPTYYEKLAAAAFLGDTKVTAVEEITFSSSLYQSAYAAYNGARLARIAFLNMKQYNSTSATARPTSTYTYSVDSELAGTTWVVERLAAPGSNVRTGITFAGHAYDYSSIGNGVDERSSHCSWDQTVKAGSEGVLSVRVKDSQAVVLT